MLIALLLGCVLLNACDPVDTPSAPGVYAAGYALLSDGNHRAKFWKDGQEVPLLGTENPSVAFSVSVSGIDTYVAGFEFINVEKTRALLWKNGVAIPLTDDTNVSGASSVCTSGQNVYVAGFFTKEGKIVPVLWSNNEAVVLPTSSGARSGQAYSVFVSGTDVYVAGHEEVGDVGHYVPMLWKNGQQVSLSVGNDAAFSIANSVFVSGADVYVAGQERISQGSSIATLWENGNYQRIMDAQAFSVCVSGSDVYMVGSTIGDPYSVAMLWENGIPYALSNDETEGNYAQSVFVSGTDVYVAGAVDNVATIWKNKEVISSLQSIPSISIANSVFVVE